MYPTIKFLFICSLLLVSTLTIKAQSQSNTQYMDNLTPYNSASSLTQPGGSVNTLVRKQWVGVTGSPSTYMINGYLPIESINATAGLMVRNDVLGVEHQTEVSAFFAKGIRLSEDQNLAVSLNVGLRGYTANYTEADAFDPTFRNNISETKPNFGFGVMFYTKDYYVGISVPQITLRTLGVASQDNVNFKNNYYLTAGYAADINEDFRLKFATLAAYTQSVPLIADVSSVVWIKNSFGVGLNYRTNNEIAGIFSVRYNKFQFGYSYQFGASGINIGGFSNATHELTLGLRFGKGSDDRDGSF